MTISTAAITVTSPYHTVEGEGAANDDLETVSGGVAGMILLLSPAHDAHTITLKDGEGNMTLGDGNDDVVMAEIEDVTTLVWTGATWYLVSVN